MDSLTALLVLIWALILSQLTATFGRQLTHEDFDDILASKYYLFVKFYAPNCGHCQKLAPVWDKLEAKLLSTSDSLVIIGKVDCTEERDLCSREGVMGFPTLKLYKSRESNGVEYEGDKSLLNLETYLRTQLGNTIVDGVTDLASDESAESHESPDTPKSFNGLYELTDENIDKFLSKGQHFVKFYAPWCGHCQRLAPTWDQLAQSFEYDTSVKISKIDCTTSGMSCKNYDIKGYPTLLWIVDGKVVDRYTGSRTHEDLKHFITEKKDIENENTEQTVTLNLSLDNEDYGPLIINEDNFGKIIKKDITFIKYWVPWCSHCKQLRPVWHQLSTKMFANNAITIASVDCSQHESLCNKQQVEGYPTLFVYKDNQKITEYDGIRDLEHIYDFVSDIVANNLLEKDEL
ncbi:thioredoxin domain-containing protein 5-like [Oppia nitens]|uniref:thioredoxin domain-containing protein 5-like n=1 Tax=Oppia nitens TaxID=1686743 RepID=UPI0023DC65B1|nr:thioredoxin domain-containing protein 5-like [Oppia nitens]